MPFLGIKLRRPQKDRKTVLQLAPVADTCASEDAAHSATPELDTQGPVTVLTDPGGKLTIDPELRQICAVMNDGSFYVHKDQIDRADIAALPHTAMTLLGLKLSDPIACEFSELQDIYGVSVTSGEYASKARAEIERILKDAADKRASDIQITFLPTGTKIVYHINGYRTDTVIELPPLLGDAVYHAAYYLADHGDTVNSSSENVKVSIADTSKLPKSVNGVRMQFARLANGRHLNMRLMYAEKEIAAGGLGSLGFDKSHMLLFREAQKSSAGLITNAAPTESGKSTTLSIFCSELMDINDNRLTVVAADDPPEGIDPRILQFSVDASVHKDGQDPFEKVLEASLRVAPHVVKIGECRTKNTALAAMQAVYTGKLVLTTLHTLNAMQIPLRYQWLGVPADTAFDPDLHRLWIAQRLVPTLCPHCKVQAASDLENPVTEALFASFEPVLQDQAKAVYVAGPGCSECRDVGSMKGLVGRKLIAEVVRPTEDLLKHLKEDTRTGRDYWLRHMNDKSMRLLGMDHLLAGTIGLAEYASFIGSADDLAFDLSATTKAQSVKSRASAVPLAHDPKGMLH